MHLYVKSFGPFDEIPDLTVQYQHGQGISIPRTALHIKSDFSQYMDATVWFSLQNSTHIDVTGTVKAKNMGILSDGGAEVTVHYATGAGVTIDGGWHLQGNLSILADPSVTIHYDKATGFKVSVSTWGMSTGSCF